MISLRNMLNSYKYMPNKEWQKKNVLKFLTTVLKYTRMAYRLNSYLYYYWQNKSDQAGDGGIAAEDRDGIWIKENDIYLYYQTWYSGAPDYHYEYEYALTIPRQALWINIEDDPYDIPTMSKILSFLKNQNIYLAQLYDLAKDLANIMLENNEVGTFKEGWQKSAEQLMERFSSLHPSKYKYKNYNSGVNLPYEGKTDYIDRINNDTIPFKWEKTYLFN